MNATLYAAQTAYFATVRAFFGAEYTRINAEHVELTALCQESADFVQDLEGLDGSDDYKIAFEFRDAAVKGIIEGYAAGLAVLTQARLQALQYNGIEIDTELIRIFLFGQNLVAMPNP